jgi:hypothetical protein
VNSRSLFIITHILDPIHLSISSSLIENGICRNQWSNVPKGKICEAMTKQGERVEEHIEIKNYCHVFRVFETTPLSADKKIGYNLLPFLFTLH